MLCRTKEGRHERAHGMGGVLGNQREMDRLGSWMTHRNKNVKEGENPTDNLSLNLL